jgi:hypothetical protein
MCRRMKSLSKVGLLVAVALLGVAALAVTAQADPPPYIGPDNTLVEGVAASPTLAYGGVTVVCDEGTAEGTTKTDDDDLDVALQFGPNPGGCTVNNAGATVACSGMAKIIALDATTDPRLGTAELNSGFSCTVTVPFTCTINVAGPQNPADEDAVLLLDEANDILSAEVTIIATRTGTTFCGAASGPATFTADYAVTPSNLTISNTP